MSVDGIGIVLAGLQAGAAIGKIGAEERQERATNEALRQRATEERIEAEQKTIKRDRQLKGLIGHQVAVEAASGFELGSQTFKAITMDDFNKFAEERSNDALELDVKENQIQQDILANKAKTKAQIFGDVLSTGASIISESGVFTNIANKIKVTPTPTTKLSTPIDEDEFNDATKTAQEKRQSGDGLFDNLGE